MSDYEFEWDEQKASENLAKHGVTFDLARSVFKDALAADWADDRYEYGEDRFNVVGMVEGRLLLVAYTLRNGTLRIISARAAEPHERRKYHEGEA
jgi:uncharacterized DUF497 family protein